MDDTVATDAEAPNTDTATNQTSDASTTTQDAPEANQATGEGSQQTDVNATDTAGDKLFAGKYKTPEEMEKAYLSLQSKATKDSQEKAELTRILNEAFQTPEQPVQQQAQQTDYEEPDPINQEIEQLKRNSAVTTFIINHPEADSQAMQKVLAEDPLVKQISGHDAKLEYAFLRSQNMARPKAIAEAEQKAASQAQAKVVEKQAAQVEDSRKAAATDETKELMERATGNYSQADRDAARQALIRKQLINL